MININVMKPGEVNMNIAPTQDIKTSNFALDVPKENISILVAEDEDATRQLLQFSLEREGYQVVTVRNGQEALQAFGANPFDIVILDINMPIIDGWTVCAELRKRTDVPIMMLTANARPDDVVHGIRLGADNYVTKPFTLKELRARVQAVLRRSMQRNQRDAANIMRCGEIVLNESTCEVTVRGKKVDLTPNEYRLLKHFLENPNKPISKEDLLTAVWDYQYQFCEDLNFIRVTIRRLRSKVEENSSSPKYLKTVHGRGYKLCNGEDPTTSMNAPTNTFQANQSQYGA